MAGSAGGPLGALLMIAPLAAIPVFAIVGVPQFASVVASPADDEEIAELPENDSLGTPTTPAAPARARTADNLVNSANDGRSGSGTAASRPAQDNEPGLRNLRSRGQTLTLPPPDALDHWEIRQSALESAPHGKAPKTSASSPPLRGKIDPPSESPELSLDDTADGMVSAEDFSPDLLKPEISSESRPRKKPPTASVNDASGNRQAPAREPSGAARGRSSKSGNDLTQSRPQTDANLAEQSGWREATRRLKELGIRRYRLDSQVEEQTFVFICSFAAVDNPRVVRRFEAEADDPLEAVQKVIDEIVEWQRQGGRVHPDAPRADTDE